MQLLLDFIIVLALIVGSGMFAAAEIALVYLRRSRVKELLSSGVPGSREVDELQNNNARFFAIVQIAITLMGTLASAIGGAAAVSVIEPVIRGSSSHWVEHWAGEISIVFVVFPIAYLSLVLGELVPKSFAMRHPEGISLFLAKPIHALGHVLRPVVWLLSKSQEVFLRLIPGGRGEVKSETAVTEGELKILIDDGMRSGAIGAAEHEIIRAAFDFADRQVRDVMVPREKIDGIREGTQANVLKTRIMEEGHTRLPVYGRDLDDIKGIIHARDIFYTEMEPGMVTLQDIVRAPYYTTPETMISRLMKEMQKNRIHMAIVRDKTGRTIGVVTLEDILEEIVGEIENERKLPTKKLTPKRG
jgi:putative hemolysin